MAVDHTRPLPVAPERLEHLAQFLFGMEYRLLNYEQHRKLYSIALQAEQVEWQQQTAFFLQEAYDIYNARFR